MSDRDHIVKEGRWEFDGDVAEVFDDMLARSIPQYDVMRKSTFELASKFVQANEAIVDLGCSHGEMIQLLIDRFGARNRYVGVDVSQPMLDKARERFKPWKHHVSIENIDLRSGFPKVEACTILAVLTLCFIPMEYRQKVVANCYEWLKQGGALIIVDKILGETVELDELYVEQHLEMKKQNGYSLDEINRKRMSLEGVLVPITSSWLRSLVLSAGFRYMDCYWRWMNFAGFVAIK